MDSQITEPVLSPGASFILFKYLMVDSTDLDLVDFSGINLRALRERASCFSRFDRDESCLFTISFADLQHS